MLFRPDRLTLTGVAILLISLAYLVKFSKRRYREWYRVRHPGSYKQEYGRYYGRYFLSALGTFFGIVLIVLGAHLATWLPMVAATKVAIVESRQSDGKMQLAVSGTGTGGDRTLSLQGKHWVVRSEVLAFHEKLAILGLGRYCRARYADGLVAPGDRIKGSYASREELAPSSPIYALFSIVSPYLAPVIRTREEVSPAKPPSGKEEVWVIEGGSAG